MRTSKRAGCDLLFGLRTVPPGNVRHMWVDRGRAGRALLQRLRQRVGGVSTGHSIAGRVAAVSLPLGLLLHASVAAAATRDDVRDIRDIRTPARACNTPGDTTTEMGRLWQSVRLTLLDARTAEGQSDIDLFERTVSRDGKKVKNTSSRSTTLPARRPFNSRAPQDIHKTGYIVEDDRESAYYAPDVDVLLSDEFMTTHCFSVEKGPRDAQHLTGLAFTPERVHEGIADIEGVFWVDRNVGGATRVEFRYTGVPTAYRSARVGGELTFAQVGNTQWLLSGWEIRMPLGVVNTRQQLAHSQSRTQKQYVIDELKSFGGAVKAYTDAGKSTPVPTR